MQNEKLTPRHDEPRVTWIPDLHYTVQPGGQFIDLEQHVGGGEMASIRLHKIHCRLLLEEAGLLSAPQAADDLTKRLASHLRDTLHDLADECGVSPGVDRIIVRLNAIIDLLPESLFQQEHDGASSAQASPEELPPFVLEPSK